MDPIADLPLGLLAYYHDAAMPPRRGRRLSDGALAGRDILQIACWQPQSLAPGTRSCQRLRAGAGRDRWN
jgi:hypothetical protein